MNKSSTGKFVETEGVVNDPGRRFPIFTSPGAYESQSHLSEEEKRLGVKMFDVNYANVPGVEQSPEHHFVQLRNPINMFQYDPELFVQDDNDANALYDVVVGYSLKDIMKTTDESNPHQFTDPEALHRFNTVLLMISRIAYEYQHDWCLQMVGTGPGWSWLSKKQLCALGLHNSIVWNNEQRLILEYTAAVIHYEVTDELFARAEALWGKKQLLRYSAIIVKYVSAIMLYHINITDAEKNGELQAEDLFGYPAEW